MTLDGTEKNFGPVSIIITNINQIHHRIWKKSGPKNFNVKNQHKSSKSVTLTLRSFMGVGLVLSKILDQYLSS